MANITNARAIKFSNERIRPAADRLLKSYSRCVAVVDAWTALGSSQAALDQMQAQITDAAERLIESFDFVYWTEKRWFNGISTFFPNDTSPVFDLNGGTGQDPGRPALTGAKVNSLVTRCIELQNWLLSAAGSFTDATRASSAFLGTVLQVSASGPVPIVLADAGNFINRCGELKTNYQATTSANLNTVLAAAVNRDP